MISRVSIGSSVSVYLLSCLFLFGLTQINHAEGTRLSKLFCPLPGNSNYRCVTHLANMTRTRLQDARKILCMKLNSELSKNKCSKIFPPRARWNFNNTHIWTNNRCIGIFKICYNPCERNEPECPDPSSDTTCETVRISGPKRIRIQRAESITCIKMVKEFSSSRCWRKCERKYYYEGFNVWSTNGCDLTARVCYKQYSREEPACPGTSSDDLSCEIVKVNGPNKRRIEKAQNISCISMVKEYSLDKCWKYGVRQYHFDDVNVWSATGCHLDVRICYKPYVNTPMKCPTEAGSRGPQQCVNVNLPSNATRTIDRAEKISCMAETQLMETCWRYGQPKYSFTDDAVRTLPGCHGDFKVCYYESCEDGKIIVKSLYSYNLLDRDVYRIAEASSIRSMEVKTHYFGNCKFGTTFGFLKGDDKVLTQDGCSAAFKICINVA